MHHSAAYWKQLSYKNKYYLRVKGWKKMFQANRLKKQARYKYYVFNKIGFQPKLIKRDRESYFKIIKEKNLPR